MQKHSKVVGVFFVLSLLLGNITKLFAEEVTGTILFEPVWTRSNTDVMKGSYKYLLDTTGDLIDDSYMDLSSYAELPFEKLTRYLQPGGQIIFETEEKKRVSGGYGFGVGRMIAFTMPDGRRIELTQLFSLDVIKREFPLLYAKLVREGKAK